MLAHVPCFGRNPSASLEFLAYPVCKACQRRGLGTWVATRVGVSHSASSPKAAQALGCTLTPGLRVTFGRVTCMARAPSVPGLWILGFLLWCCVCAWVWGFPATPPFLAGDGAMPVRVGGFAFVPPFLAGARGACAPVRVRVEN